LVYKKGIAFSQIFLELELKNFSQATSPHSTIQGTLKGFKPLWWNKNKNPFCFLGKGVEFNGKQKAPIC
jgi:hypothetical protein